MCREKIQLCRQRVRSRFIGMIVLSSLWTAHSARVSVKDARVCMHAIMIGWLAVHGMILAVARKSFCLYIDAYAKYGMTWCKVTTM